MAGADRHGVRLAGAGGARTEFPRRRLDRPAALHPAAAAADRHGRQRPAPAGAGQRAAHRAHRRAQGKAAADTSLTPNAGLVPVPGAGGASGPARGALPDRRRRGTGDRHPGRAPAPDRGGDPGSAAGGDRGGRSRGERPRHLQPDLPRQGRLRDQLGRGGDRAAEIRPLARSGAAYRPRAARRMPAATTDTKTLVDLTDSPWSGARVRYHIVVKDEAGQEGRTPDTEITLPARPFRDPLARALAEERRRLVTAPDSGSPLGPGRAGRPPRRARHVHAAARRSSSGSGPRRSACAGPGPTRTSSRSPTSCGRWR